MTTGVVARMETTAEDLATTPLIVPEIDHLVSRGGEDAAAAFYEDLTGGAYLVEWWPEAVSETVEAAGKNPGLGLADASLLALAAGWRPHASRRSTSYISAWSGPLPGRLRLRCCLPTRRAHPFLVRGSRTP